MINMAGIVTNANAGRKRRLPTWMMSVNAADKLSPVEDNKKSVVSEEQPETKAAKSKIKTITGKPDRTAALDTGGTERVQNSQESKAKRRTRKVSRRDDDPSNSVINCDETGLPRKKLWKEGGGRVVHKLAASTKQNLKSCEPRNSELESASQESNGDEIELTVEDLVSIAEEYVIADREKQHSRSATRDSNSEINLPSLPIASKTNLVGPTEATGCSQALSRCTTRQSSHLSEIGRKETESHAAENFASNTISSCTTARCNSHLTEIGSKENERPITENFTANITRTGDAAQDMLNLFLGPLLMKSPPEERGMG